jgi:hypothetical protein
MKAEKTIMTDSNAILSALGAALKQLVAARAAATETALEPETPGWAAGELLLAAFQDDPAVILEACGWLLHAVGQHEAATQVENARLIEIEKGK